MTSEPTPHRFAEALPLLSSLSFLFHPSPYSLKVSRHFLSDHACHSPLVAILAVTLRLGLRYSTVLLPIVSPVIVLVPIRLPGFRSLSSPAPPDPRLRLLRDAVFLLLWLIVYRPRISKDLVDDLADPVRPDIDRPAFDGDRVVQYRLTSVARALQRLASACPLLARRDSQSQRRSSRNMHPYMLPWEWGQPCGTRG